MNDITKRKLINSLFLITFLLSIIISGIFLTIEFTSVNLKTSIKSDNFNHGIGKFWIKNYYDHNSKREEFDDWEWVADNGHAVPKLLESRDEVIYANLSQYASSPYNGNYEIGVTLFKYATSTTTGLALLTEDENGNLIGSVGIYDAWANSDYQFFAQYAESNATRLNQWISETEIYTTQINVRITHLDNKISLYINSELKLEGYCNRSLNRISLRASSSLALTRDGELVNRTDTQWFDDFYFIEGPPKNRKYIDTDRDGIPNPYDSKPNTFIFPTFIFIISGFIALGIKPFLRLISIKFNWRKYFPKFPLIAKKEMNIIKNYMTKIEINEMQKFLVDLLKYSNWDINSLTDKEFFEEFKNLKKFRSI